ncbi:MAG: DUF6197 family protein [Pseudohongiellaceae bacterium]
MPTTIPKPTKKEIAAALIGARALIAKPENWIRRFYAANNNPEADRINPGDKDASRFCAIGAIMHWNRTANPRRESDPNFTTRPNAPPGEHLYSPSRMLEFATESALSAAIGEDVADWNDSKPPNHDKIIAGFDKAIKENGGGK